MYTENCDDDAEYEVEGDEELVKRASRSSKERVQDTGQSNSSRVRRSCRADKDPLPEV